MRILFFFCCCIFFNATLSAQYERGNWYLDTNTDISGLGGSDGVRLETGVGYFVRDRFLVGSRIETGNGFSGFKGGDVWVNPFARYYFPTKKTNLNFFAEAGASLGFGVRGGRSLTAAVGAEYQLAPGIMLTGSLNYATKNEYSGHQLGLNLGLNVILGEKYRPEGRYDFLHRRGTLMLNGNIGNLTLNTADGQTDLLGSINLEAGYFLTERFAMEGKLEYTAGYLELGTSEIPRNYRTRSVEATVGGRYFFLPGRRFQPYVSGGISYEHGYWRETSSDPMRSSDYNSFSGYLKAGFLHHLNNRLAIDFNFGYRRSFSGEDSRGFTGDIGLKVFLGKQQ